MKRILLAGLVIAIVLVPGRSFANPPDSYLPCHGLDECETWVWTRTWSPLWTQLDPFCSGGSCFGEYEDIYGVCNANTAGDMFKCPDVNGMVFSATTGVWCAMHQN
jgi:hypothetical protein